MGENRFHRRALDGIGAEDAGDEILAETRNRVWIHNGVVLYRALHLDQRVSGIGGLARAQFIGENAQRPYIRLQMKQSGREYVCGVIQTLGDLGGNVGRRATNRRARHFCVHRPTEIGQLWLFLRMTNTPRPNSLSDQHVLRLYVSVNHVLLVHVLQGSRDPLDHPRRLLLRKGPFPV